MSDIVLDKFGLMDETKPIMDRYEIFFDELKEAGLDPRAINEGTLDAHLVSHIFGIAPQIVRMFFGIYLCDEEQRNLISEKNLPTGVVRTLMLIEDDIREEICQHLNGVLDSASPIRSLIDYVDNGSWRTRIDDVYAKVDPNYWAAVSSYLKDTSTKGKEMNAWFRKLLMDIKIYKKASKKQLSWLERGIIEDYTEELGVFCSEFLRKEFPESVKVIEKFLDDYVRFDLL